MSKFKPGDDVRLKRHHHIHGIVISVINDTESNTETKYDVTLYRRDLKGGIYLESSLERDIEMEALTENMERLKEIRQLRRENKMLKEDIKELVDRLVKLEQEGR